MNIPINDLFSHKLSTEDGKEKVAAMAQTFVRDKLRENAFSRKILPPQKVTRADMQVSVNHDTLVYIDEIEPNSRAMPLTFRGQPTANFISAPRYEIPVFTISSEKFEKTEQELLAYRMSITKIIEDNSVKDIQEIEDYRFLVYVDAAVAATTGSIIRGRQATDDAALNGAGNGLRGELQREDLVDLMKVLDSRRRKLDCFLINEDDSDSCLKWQIEDFGDSKQSDVVVNGFSPDTILGRKVIRTVKTDILQSGNIYGFTTPDFLGKFLVLNNTKFYIDKVANLIMWQCWEDIGMGIGNIASIAKLELYNGQGSGDDSSDTLADEDSIGSTVYNEAADGNTFPQVSVF